MRAKREDRQEYHRQYYQTHREELLTRSKQNKAEYKQFYKDDPVADRKYTQRRQRDRDEFIQQLKVGLACKRCGNDDVRVLDFHHLDKNAKEASISKMISGGWSKARIALEVAKCEVLCANCHRILHWEERNSRG